MQRDGSVFLVSLITPPTPLPVLGLVSGNSPNHVTAYMHVENTVRSRLMRTAKH